MDKETDIMDFYTSESKFSDLIETDFNDILNQDDITPPHNSPLGLEHYDMDADWLDSFLEDPILNDRMITDALHPAPITNEHSYSLNRTQNLFNNTKTDIHIHKDLDMDLVDSQMGNTPLNLTMTIPVNGVTSPASSISSNSSCSSSDILLNTDSCTVIKQEPPSPTMVTQQNDSLMFTTTTMSQAMQPNCQTLLKQPTIILATTQAQTAHIAPKVSIKVEPQDTFMTTTHHYMYDTVGLPPTPPSSSSSDSEGSQSPGRSMPSSPIRQSHSSPCSRQVSSHAALFSQPIPTSGVLILTEEEKRTLISEGYPIPSKLPLTKQEEKNLKKIRRKIKNKISAQESRRKKKEYMETLEKRMEMYSQENLDLKKKVDNLECNNRSLMSQLQKLQSIVSRVTKGAATNGTQSSTCLMVLVLCFAVFLGGWSPLHNGGSSMVGSAGPVTMGPTGIPMGPEVKDASVDAYATPNMRSRVLLSMMEEDEQYGPYTPFSYRDIFHRLLHGSYMMYPSCETEQVKPSHPQVPKALVEEAATPPRNEAPPTIVTMAAKNATHDPSLPNVTGAIYTGRVAAVTVDSRNIHVEE